MRFHAADVRRIILPDLKYAKPTPHRTRGAGRVGDTLVKRGGPYVGQIGTNDLVSYASCYQAKCGRSGAIWNASSWPPPAAGRVPGKILHPLDSQGLF